MTEMESNSLSRRLVLWFSSITGVTCSTCGVIIFATIALRKIYKHSKKEERRKMCRDIKISASFGLGHGQEIKYNQLTRTIEIPGNMVRYVVGPGAFLLRQIEEKANVRIRFGGAKPGERDGGEDSLNENEDEFMRKLIIAGSTRSILAAMETIHNILEHFPESKTLVTKLQPEAVGKLVGKGGCVIKDVMRLCNANIHVERASHSGKEEDLRNVIVTGTPQEIEHAKDVIFEAIDNKVIFMERVKMFEENKPLPPIAKNQLVYKEEYHEVWKSLDVPERSNIADAVPITSFEEVHGSDVDAHYQELSENLELFEQNNYLCETTFDADVKNEPPTKEIVPRIDPVGARNVVIPPTGHIIRETLPITKGRRPIEVVVTCVESPYLLWVQKRSCMRKVFKMSKELKSKVDTAAAEGHHASTLSLEAEHLVLVKHPNLTEVWCRCIARTTPMDGKVHAFFVDFGFCKNVSCEDVCGVMFEERTLAAQAIPCALASVLPALDSGNWSPKCTKYLREFEGKLVKIYKEGERQLENGKCLEMVTLVDSSNKLYDINVNCELVDKNFAIKSS